MKEEHVSCYKEPDDNLSVISNKSIQEKTMAHPCYNGCNHENARMHLPVAPKCNIQCNYCVRKFDCVNESRPGVTTRLMTPEQALLAYREAKTKVPGLSVVGIAGPGDALCDFANTEKTLDYIRKEDPDVTFCLSTNGLLLPDYALRLTELGVTHVTVTMNAVDPEVSKEIYRYITYQGVTYTGLEASTLLLENQLKGLQILIEQGVVCKINVVLLKGINDHHIAQISSKAKELGCYMVNIMPLIPVEGSGFAHLETSSPKELDAIRGECGKIVKQMTHCRQCRADAVGTL